MLQVNQDWGDGYYGRLLSPEINLSQEHCFRALVVSVEMKIWARFPNQFRLIFYDFNIDNTYYIVLPLMPGKQQIMIGGRGETVLAETTLVQGSCLDLCK